MTTTKPLKIYLDMQATQGGGSTGLGSVATTLAQQLLSTTEPQLSFQPIIPQHGKALRTVWDRIAWEQWYLPAAIKQDFKTNANKYLPILQSLCLGTPLTLNMPTVAIVYDFIPLQDKNSFTTGLAGWYFRKYLPYCYQRATKLLCISQTVCLQALQILKRQERDIHLLPLFVRPELTSAISTLPSLKRDCIISVGTHEPRKNLETVIKAYSSLKKDLQEQFPLIIIGKHTKHTQKLLELVNSLNLNSNVKLVDYVSTLELAQYYKKAVVNVFVSKFEGFGLPPLEALIAGCPSVISDIPVHQEIYGSYFNLVTPEDVSEIAKQIEYYCQSSDSTISKQNQAATLLLEKYSISQAVAACKRVYYELV